LFQKGKEKAFDEWQAENKEAYEKFVDWYTAAGNKMTVTPDNRYIRE